jgi:hypothetical protein
MLFYTVITIQYLGFRKWNENIAGVYSIVKGVDCPARCMCIVAESRLLDRSMYESQPGKLTLLHLTFYSGIKISNLNSWAPWWKLSARFTSAFFLFLKLSVLKNDLWRLTLNDKKKHCKILQKWYKGAFSQKRFTPKKIRKHFCSFSRDNFKKLKYLGGPKFGRKLSYKDKLFCEDVPLIFGDFLKTEPQKFD